MKTSAGLHMTIGNHDGFEALLKRTVAAGKPLGLVYVLADGGGLETQTWSPETTVVFRCWGSKYTSEDTPPGNWGDSGWTNIPQMAKDWMAELYPLWERNPAHFYEFLNEPDPVGDRGAGNAAEFVQRCMEDAESHGFKTSIWAFAAGCPRSPTINPSDFAQAEAILPTLKWAAEHAHAFSLHDGSVNDDRRLLKQAYEDKTALRYRYVKALMDARGWPMPQVHLTEVYQVDGYRRPDWGDWNFYLTEVHKDAYVSGAAWFTLGEYRFSPEASVNVVSQLGRYGDLIVGKDWVASEPAPVSEGAVFLNVPFIPQIGPGADFTNNDCGTADLAMMAVALGDSHDEVDYWSRLTGAAPGALINIGQLQQAAAANGYVLTRHNNQSLASLRAVLEQGRPAMLLINAGAGWEHQPNYTGPHFALATGFSRTGDVFYFHDSYFQAGKRGGAYVRQTDLLRAWGSCHLQYDNPDFVFMTLDRPTPVPITTIAFGVGMGDLAMPTPAQVNAIRDAKLDAIKVLSLPDPRENRMMVQALRQSLPELEIWARLFFSPDAENRTPFPPAQFIDTVLGAALALYSEGVRYFEVHNEPNLAAEGWGWNWQDGQDFGAWLVEVMDRLRQFMPEARLGFPGLSPGDGVAGVRAEATAFWKQAAIALARADFVCAHSYWYAPGPGYWGQESETGGMSWQILARLISDKPLMITEFSNNNKDVEYAIKGAQYAQYEALLRATGRVRAAFAFALSWQSDNRREAWVRPDGSTTAIPASVGARVTG